VITQDPTYGRKKKALSRCSPFLARDRFVFELELQLCHLSSFNHRAKFLVFVFPMRRRTTRVQRFLCLTSSSPLPRGSNNDGGGSTFYVCLFSVGTQVMTTSNAPQEISQRRYSPLLFIFSNFSGSRTSGRFGVFERPLSVTHT
jgi:hypothetical protein